MISVHQIIQFGALLGLISYYAPRIFPGLKCGVNIVCSHVRILLVLSLATVYSSSLCVFTLFRPPCDDGFPCTLIPIPGSDDLLGQTPRGRRIGSQARGIYFGGSGQRPDCFSEGRRHFASPSRSCWGHLPLPLPPLTGVLVGSMFICQSDQSRPCLEPGASGDERRLLWPVTFPWRVWVAGFCVFGVGSTQSRLSGSSEKGRSRRTQIGVGGRRNLFTEPSLGCRAPS